jgi:hypothetical protein
VLAQDIAIVAGLGVIYLAMIATLIAMAILLRKE